MALVLFAPDVSVSGSAAARRWVAATCRALKGLGHTVLLHPRERDLCGLAEILAADGHEVLRYDAFDPDHEDDRGHLPRFRARRLVSIARFRKVDWVLTQGVELSLALAGGRALQDRLVAMPVDVPYRTDPLPKDVLDRLAPLLQGSQRLLVAAEAQRAVLEATTAAATSRVFVMPPSAVDVDGTAASPQTEGHDDGPVASGADLEVNLDYFAEGSLPDLRPYAEAARALRTVPRVTLTGDGSSPEAGHDVWRSLPGRVLGHAADAPGAVFGLLPDARDVVGRAHAVDYCVSRGLIPVAVAGDRPEEDPRVTVVDSSADLLRPPAELQSDRDEHVRDVRDRSTVRDAEAPAPLPPAGWFPADGPSRGLRRADGRPLRVVLAGADFKFAGDMITALVEHPDVDVRIDLFAHNSTPQPEVSREYLEWADVVIAEFSSWNAIWYSRNIGPHQRLIVHLHGFELREEWIDQLRADRCAAIVVASEFYRERALSTMDWDPDLVRVVPNSVDDGELRREKFADARFHLGLAGYVPILKRPDRAVDLLRLLRAEDDRYVLHLRGHSPWDYGWEWKKSVHQDAYREVFRRIGRDPDLLSAVSFEPFGPDMGNWLRRVGWILSPSYRETFHLAGIEGAASGAVPLVWEREGSREIFSDRWNFSSTEQIAEFVLSANADPASYRAESVAAQRYALRYGTAAVSDRWLDLIAEVHRRPGREAVEVHTGTPAAARPTDPVEAALLAEVDQALEAGSYERALEVLDEGIAVTARSASGLKDAELWVRGVAALDARRLSLYLPKTVDSFSVERRPLTVRRAGDSSSQWARLGLELDTLDLAEYPYADPLAQSAGGHDDIQHDTPLLRSAPGERVRADRWLEAHAAEISVQCLRRGVDQVLARGPWWVGLASALAGDRLGLPVTWIVTDPMDVYRAARALMSPFSADFIEYTALRTFEGMSRVVDETGTIADSPLASVVSLADAPVTELPGVIDVRRHASPTSYTGVPRALERPLEDLRVLVAGDSDFVSSWAATGARVTALSPDDVAAPVPPDADLVVLDAQLIHDPAWTRHLTSTSATGATGGARLFDTARASGARALVVGHGLAAWPASLTATLRKADVVTVTGQAQAGPLLRLNPLSVERVLPVSADRPWETAPEHFLRRAGLPVRITTPRPDAPAEEPYEAPGDLRSGEVPPLSAGDGLGPDDEGISVVLATHRGADRIGTMLDSIAAQTLPARLIEVIVVENGGEPESRETVRRFGRDTGISTRYLFLPEPGVGGARNLGIAEATREYLTFVDDDDVLEKNYLLSAWLTASPRDVVLSTLHDLSADGVRNERTPGANSVRFLQGSRQPLGWRPGALGQNACKLIPTAVARQCRYPEHLRSGEDVAFMSQLLGRGLRFTPAAPMPESAYLRVLRDNSVSRRELTFDFAVRERLEVLAELKVVRERLDDDVEVRAVQTIMKAQAGFVARYRAAHPAEAARVDAAVAERGLGSEVALA